MNLGFSTDDEFTKLLVDKMLLATTTGFDDGIIVIELDTDVEFTKLLVDKVLLETTAGFDDGNIVIELDTDDVVRSGCVLYIS